ncbi:MAG: iron(III) transport system ATP-binding protein [Actinomycetota bacterium]|nr:iron(III) transport system ATP-binding protein [Actinomycetota bacterium]
MTADAPGRLSLRELGKTFGSGPGSVPAVEGVDLEIESGEFITLLGPSGCGKTTTLRMVAGFEDPTAGRILLDRSDLDGVPPNKRPMAMVFQSYALFPHLTVYDNVAYGLRLKRARRATLDDSVQVALTTMNLAGLADRMPHQLSGGQQQRVALARAMVMQPTVMLFDEPLSNLDAKLRAQMRLEIRVLARRMGITSLYVTHDQEEAMSLSDRIVIMNRGKVEQVGTPPEIYLRPASVFVADFIGRASFLPCTAGAVTSQGTAVRVLGREVFAPSRSEIASGDPALLMLRPEWIALAPSQEKADGVVLSSSYLGTTVEYEVETLAGILTASVPSPAPETILDDGCRVGITFDEARSYLLPDVTG